MQDSRRKGVAKNDGADRHSLIYTRMPLGNPEFITGVLSACLAGVSAGARHSGARWAASRVLVGGGVSVVRATALSRSTADKILKRHPEFIGREVIEELGPEHTVRIQWVWYLM